MTSTGPRSVLPSHTLLWWDSAMVAAAVVSVVLAALDGAYGASGVAVGADGAEVSTGAGIASRIAGTTAVLLVLAAAYLFLGRTALVRAQRDLPLRSREIVFVLLLVVAVGFAALVHPWFAMLQVVAYPLVWSTVSSYRAAIAGSAVLALLVSVGTWVSLRLNGQDFSLLNAAFNALLTFVFAVAMGTWITRIFARGEQHRLLAEKLRGAQNEVAALSKEAGASAERERISRELHDTLTQTLAGLVMLSEQASRALEAGETSRARDRLERVQTTARDAVAEARALVATTHPLGDGGLEASLTRIAARLQADTELVVSCDLEPVALPREHEVVLLRAAQEGLANARRHSRAAHVSVRLREEIDAVVLQVEDDGVGIGELDLAEPSSGGFGLSGLAERVRLVGGSISLVPGAEGRGTLLEVRVVRGDGAATTTEGTA